MNHKKLIRSTIISAASLAAAVTPSLFAAPLTPGDIFVVQVGANGSGTALAATATATFLNEYNLVGALIQQIALPTVASGSSDILTLSGNSTAEGFLSVSTDGNYLTLGGYNQTLGGTTGTSTAATVNRVVGVIGYSGAPDTTTAINAGTSGNIRSATTINGSSFYVGSSSAGVGYLGTAGSASSAIQLSTAPTNVRVVKTANGQLYVSSASGAFLGVSTVGSGLPTTSGQTTSLLSGFPTTGTHSSYDYWFMDANTLYVADDGTTVNGGGIQKWTQSGGTWTLAYTLLNSGSTTPATVRGLTGEVVGGNVELFGTTGTSLIEVTDTGASAADTVLATAAANTAFRGVAIIPEPSTYALLGMGLASLFMFRRKK